MSQGVSKVVRLDGTNKNDIIVAKSTIATSYSIFGFAGNDKLAGAGGNDSIYGGAGNDTVAGGAGNDELRGGLGNDLVTGGLGNDVLISGSSPDGQISDTLQGGAGNDVLFAYDRSFLTGGADKDIFVFGKGSDYSQTQDFEHGVDKIDVSAFGVRGLDSIHIGEVSGTSQNVLSLVLDEYVGGGVVKHAFTIGFGQHDVHLDGTDFIFAAPPQLPD